MVGVIALLAVVCAAALVGGLLRWRAGRPGRAGSAPARLGPVELGGPLGERATLVQFSSAFCAPCRVTRVQLGRLADRLPGVRYAEVDAESHLDLVRRLSVRRTPTTLLLDPTGLVRRRAEGQPRTEQLLAALAEVGACDDPAGPAR